MTILKKYNLAGQEIGQMTVDDQSLQTVANSQMIKDYLIALRANARQWSANTKTRAEVNHSGQKPHPQKGTGRARQGYLGAPQYKGGGRVFAPRPKFDQHVRINKKERRAAIRQLLVEKIQGGRVHILKYEPIEKPQTKKVVEFLENCELSKKRVLFLGEGFIDAQAEKGLSPSHEEKYGILIKSLRNVPKINFMLTNQLSGYDILVSHDLVVMEPAIDELMMILGGKG